MVLAQLLQQQFPSLRVAPEKPDDAAQPSISIPEAPKIEPAPAEEEPKSFVQSLFSQRSRRQLGIFAAGATFFLLSTTVTRRAVTRRIHAARPAFYFPNSRPNHANGPMDAAEALGLATLNVFSAAIMLTGGTMWAFDISSLQDLQNKYRAKLEIQTGGVTDKKAEEEVEEWIAMMLSRKEAKDWKAVFEAQAKREEEKHLAAEQAKK